MDTEIKTEALLPKTALITASSLDFNSLNQPVSPDQVRAYLAATKKTSNFNPLSNRFLRVIIFLIAGYFTIGLIGYFLYMLKEVPVAAILGLVIIVGGISSIFYGLRWHRKNRARFFSFAVANNMEFLQGRQATILPGMIFDNGHSRRILEGFRLSDETEIANFEYTTGSGKNRQAHRWGYVKLKLPRRLPHMVLDAKSNNTFKRFSTLADKFDKNQVLSLEGDFDRHFTLYAPKQYERDALYVFTPDVMAKLIDSGKDYDIEIIDDSMFIYALNGYKLKDEATWHNLLSIVNLIGVELHEQTDYYADERVGDRTQNIIASSGMRLKHSFRWAAVIGIIIYILIQILPSILRFLTD